jgi:hypothetical protein
MAPESGGHGKSSDMKKWPLLDANPDWLKGRPRIAGTFLCDRRAAQAGDRVREEMPWNLNAKRNATIRNRGRGGIPPRQSARVSREDGSVPVQSELLGHKLLLPRLLDPLNAEI